MSEAAKVRVHLTVADARALCERALRSIGYNEREAWIIADHVIEAALCGYEYSGLAKLLNVVDQFVAERSPPSVVRDNGAALSIDGGNNNGMLAIYDATQEAIERAQAHGMSIVVIDNIWLSGRGAYYVEMIARAGMIGIHTASASHLRVAPPGAARAALGTNPIAFAFPTDGEPLSIDMGTAAFMGTDLRYRARVNMPVPQGVAIDAAGHSSTDAAAILAGGALLPFGGHKGFCLGLAVHALGLLAAAGNKPDNTNGYFIIAIKPDLFVPLDVYRQALSQEIDRIKSTPKQDGVLEIRIPGERARKQRQQLLEQGIEIDRSIYDSLSRIAR